MDIPSLLRLAEHRALSRLTLSGSVLDLGGSKHSGYLSYIKGEYVVTTVNLDEETEPDIMHDLEQPLPFVDASYDNVILINVLEHIFNYQQLLTESARALKPGSRIAVVVPFFFPIHPSPRDYWRFTGEALAEILAAAGFRDIKIEPLGSGVFSARYVALDRLMPFPMRLLGYYTCRYAVLALDRLFTAAARALGKKYSPADYALGYMVVATK